MRLRAFFRAWALVLALGAPQVSYAQIPVTDAGNLFQNTISAVQSVLTTIQTVLIEANQILELESLGDIATAGGIAEDMKLLALLVEQAQGLSYDLSSLEAQIQSLFGLDSAPTTVDGLRARMAEIRHYKLLAYSYAARVQTLLKTAARTTEHLVQMLDTIAAILGNKQANQTHVQVSTVAAKHLANIDVNMSAYQRAHTIDALADALITESIRKIEEARMEDWPSF